MIVSTPEIHCQTQILMDITFFSLFHLWGKHHSIATLGCWG